MSRQKDFELKINPKEIENRIHIISWIKERLISSGDRELWQFTSEPGYVGNLLFMSEVNALEPSTDGEKYISSCIDALKMEAGLLSFGFNMLRGGCGRLWAADKAAIAPKDVDSVISLYKMFDPIVESIVGNKLLDMHYDLISGLSGYLLYSIDRKCFGANMGIANIIKNRILEYRFDQSDGQHLRIPCNNKYKNLKSKFFDISDEQENELVDFGMAHGMCGAISALSALANFTKDQNLIRDTIIFSEYIYGKMKNISSEPLYDSTNMSPGRTRMSWCYGDLSTAIALTNAGAIFTIDKYKEVSQRILSRYCQNSSIYLDLDEITICHGLAGTSHIIRRMHSQYEDEILLTQAEKLLSECVSRIDPERMTNISFSSNYISDFVGVGLCLVSSISGSSPMWDSFIFGGNSI